MAIVVQGPLLYQPLTDSVLPTH